MNSTVPACDIQQTPVRSCTTPGAATAHPPATRHRLALAAFYDRLHDDPRYLRSHYYYERLKHRIAQLVPPGARVLDLGCGAGDMLAALQPSVGVGVDVSAAMVREARLRHPQYRFHQLAAEDVATFADTFDYIIISQTLGEIHDLVALFSALRKVCHARTRLIIAHDNRLWQPMLKLAEWLGMKRPTPEVNWIPSDEVEHLLSLAGFETIRAIGLTLLPVRIPFISNAVNRWIGNLPLLHHLGLNYILVARPLEPTGAPRRKPESVSIIVPARNESGHIAAIIERLPAVAPRQEVIFVEGGSRDDTWEVIQRAVAEYCGPFQLSCMRQDGKGKGDAVRKGFAAATGEVLMIFDADLGVPPEELPAFFSALADGKGEFINGSRMVYLMDKRAMRFLNLLANKTFGGIFTYLLSQRFRDTLCGTKVLHRRDYERIAKNRAHFGDFDPFGDFDLLFGAAKLGMKIIDLPVHYAARTYGETNISRFRHGWMLLKMCFVAATKLKFV